MAQSEYVMDLATASHILARHGVVDAFGHVSMRNPYHPKEQFLLSRNLAPALVQPQDIIAWQVENAEPVELDSPRGFVERHIHAQIYRRFPDVQAVVHFHSPDVIPFGLSSRIPFRPVYHMTGFLGTTSPPIFDIRDRFGPSTDLLIRNEKHGEALASSFGSEGDEPRPLVLMRGHGATVVASSLKLVVYRAIYTQTNAKILTSLSSLVGGVNSSGMDEVRFLSADESKNAAEANAGQVDRAWNIWVKDAENVAQF